MGASLGLILYADMMAGLEGRERLGTLGQLLLLEHPPLGVGHLTLGSSQAPLLSGDELARLQGEEVPEDPAKDYLGRAEAGQGTGSVPVLEDGSGQVISVEGASLGCVAPDQSFGRLDCDLGPLVCPGMVGGAHPVDDPELVAEGLHLPRGEHFGAVTGEHHWDPKD